jgi:hypothetical protein
MAPAVLIEATASSSPRRAPAVLIEMISVGEIGEKDQRARFSPDAAGVLSDVHSDAGV